MKKLSWGILSTGTIAKKFADTARMMGDEVKVQAVASRGAESARAFAAQYGIPTAYADYEALAKDPEVDAVYIGTPHAFHYENMMMCLEAGKHVLCEKSFTVTAEQARAAYAEAKKRGLFLMEAYWTAFLPAVAKMKELLAQGAIGEAQFAAIQYGFTCGPERAQRKFDPALAGGALLDIGIYNIAMACMVFGYEPQDIFTHARLGDVGTDASSAILLTYPGGKFAQLTTAIQTLVPPKACIYGEKGHLIIPGVNSPQQVELVLNGEEPQIFDAPFELTGFEYQIREAQACILAGKTESALYPPEASAAVMEIMDKVRGQWGMKFPFEK